MRDVAALAGVSLKTVSRVVNGEPGVSPVLMARVETAARALDYTLDHAASTLRRTNRKSATIGLLLKNIANPFSAALYRAIENVARTRGVVAFAGSLDEDPERERALATLFSTRRVDGLIVVPAGSDQSYLQGEAEAGLPMVFVDRPPLFLDADAILTDNREGARTGVRHLLAVGHRRIAYLGDLITIATARERHDGYLDALRGAGLTPDRSLIRDDLHTSDAAEAATVEILGGSDPPTAIFASQNLVTIGAIRALRRLRQQHQVAIVGFDDFLLADLLEPAVSVVAQDPATIGRLAAETLFRRLDGDTSPPTTVIVPTRLIPRGSGEIPPPA
jgi:LacI family transcriptional regulator, galactose operon repressor